MMSSNGELKIFPKNRFIYGGVGMGVGAAAVITILALSNVSSLNKNIIVFTNCDFLSNVFLAFQRSYIWTRVVKFLWPFIIVISAVRAILMIVQLQRG